LLLLSATGTTSLFVLHHHRVLAEALHHFNENVGRFHHIAQENTRTSWQSIFISLNFSNIIVQKKGIKKVNVK